MDDQIQYLFGTNTIGGGIIANNAFDASWNLITSTDANGGGIPTWSISDLQTGWSDSADRRG
jgi:hypothetical protein